MFAIKTLFVQSFTVSYPEIFLGNQFQQGFGGRGDVMPSCGSRVKPRWDQVVKLPEALRV